MRVIHTDEIIQNISEMCIEANMYLPQDVEQAMQHAGENERSPLGRQILSQLGEICRLRQQSRFRSVRTPAWQSFS